MKIKSNTLAILVVVILFGGIFTSSAMNMWKTESSKVPKLIEEGDFKGEYNPEDIRGSYSFGEVSELFNIPLEDLADAFDLPKEVEVTEFKNKDLETLYEGLEFEVGNSSVKLFVALYKGLPYELEDDTYLLQNAVKILIDKGHLTEEQLEFLASHTVDMTQVDISTEVNTNIDENKEYEEEATVKGKTTFKEVIEFGVSKEKIEEIIGAPLPNPVMSIRDYCVDNGLSFSTVKTALQEEVDTVK